MSYDAYIPPTPAALQGVDHSPVPHKPPHEGQTPSTALLEAPGGIRCPGAAPPEPTTTLAAIQQRIRELLAGRHLPQQRPSELTDYLSLREQAIEAEADEQGQHR